MEIDFQLGTVLSTDPNTKDSNGNIVPSINVKCHQDSSTLSIPLSSAAWNQAQPIPGYKVLFFRFGQHYARPIIFWGNDEDFMRKGEAGLNPGDVVIQSPAGFGYLRLAADGRVQLVGGDMASLIDFTSDGVQIKTPNLKLLTYADTVFEINESGVISITQFDKSGNAESYVVLDSERNVSVVSKTSITLKAPNIYIDGNVFMGGGAADMAKRQLFGNVVTSGQNGTLPFDLVSGAPIPGSQTIKVAM